MSQEKAEAGPEIGDSILIVDDDDAFSMRLARAFKDRGFLVRVAQSCEEARGEIEVETIAWAVVDLKLPDGSGLEVIRDIVTHSPDAQCVMLTGYGSISTAVDAGRLGALNYIAKPVDADMVLAAFRHTDPLGPTPDLSDYATPSLARTEWEHINRVLKDCGGNVSEAARTLGLHRRTLQRKLKSMPPQS